jgi:NAD(P)H-nitrite reductase large subunit
LYTVFGDEPYGNYNRILLSSVLNGLQDQAEIFLNGLSWYKDNEIDLHADVRVDAWTSSRGRTRRCIATIATGIRPTN